MAADAPTLLAFDTSAAHCAAALLHEGRLVADIFQPMAKGQAEALMPLLADTLARAGLTWRDLDALAVGIGPGNFTGTRISVAAARGMALALAIPAIGVSTFEIMLGPDRHASAALVSIAAPRGMAYGQVLRNGTALSAPLLIDPTTALTDLPVLPDRVAGFRADEIARHLSLPTDAHDEPRGPVGATLARIAARKLAEGAPSGRPAPLYVRPADAALPSDPPLVILP